MTMNKKSIITLTAILLCFVILLSLGLHYTAEPSIDKTIKKFTSMGYLHATTQSGKINAHTFKNGDEYVLIVWYKSSDNAVKALSAASKMNASGILRGNAVAIGSEKALSIFKTV